MPLAWIVPSAIWLVLHFAAGKRGSFPQSNYLSNEALGLIRVGFLQLLLQVSVNIFLPGEQRVVNESRREVVRVLVQGGAVGDVGKGTETGRARGQEKILVIESQTGLG